MNKVDRIRRFELINEMGFEKIEVDTGAVIAVSEYLPGVEVIQKLDEADIHETDEEAAKYYAEVTGAKYFTDPTLSIMFKCQEFYLDTPENRKHIKEALEEIGSRVA